MEDISVATVRNSLGHDYEAIFSFLPAVGTKGGSSWLPNLPFYPFIAQSSLITLSLQKFPTPEFLEIDSSQECMDPQGDLEKKDVYSRA
jgi:hypothetical protein